MLSAHAVGTVDQAMLAGMNVKFGFLRLYGLLQRVLIIDEIHAYDYYMTSIIARLLQWCSCLSIPVILLSATLSDEQKRIMIDAYGSKNTEVCHEDSYPLVTVTGKETDPWVLLSEASSERTLFIKLKEGFLGDEEKTAELAKELTRSGGNCCVILNTVKQAQKVYKALDLPEEEKMLFHARFTAEDRDIVTKKVQHFFGKDRTNRPDKFVLVATQVVEQSLDVDFDFMISELAPIDLLLQRSGRMHRHKKRNYPPTLFILLPEIQYGSKIDFGGTGWVYAEKPLLRTIAILDCYEKFKLPEKFRSLIGYCYGKEKWDQNMVPWELIEKADEEWEAENQLLWEKGRSFVLREPKKRYFQPVNNDPVGDDSDDGNGWRASTRLGANDKTAILIKEVELQILRKGDLNIQEIRNLYRRSIKLPGYLSFDDPLKGYVEGVEAQGRLKGVTLLPLAENGIWKGRQANEQIIEVFYDSKTGLETRREK
jgi:CRISPR-associated endonuclease/helicase Cas3